MSSVACHWERGSSLLWQSNGEASGSSGVKAVVVSQEPSKKQQ